MYNFMLFIVLLIKVFDENIKSKRKIVQKEKHISNFIYFTRLEFKHK